MPAEPGQQLVVPVAAPAARAEQVAIIPNRLAPIHYRPNRVNLDQNAKLQTISPAASPLHQLEAPIDIFAPVSSPVASIQSVETPFNGFPDSDWVTDEDKFHLDHALYLSSITF